MKKVLFVCLGNICRSPLAEGLAIKLAEELGISDQVSFDSCGTGNYHIGELPDSRTRNNAEQNGLKLTSRARQFEKKDFRAFDHILVMDAANLSNIKKIDMTNQFSAKIQLMRDFDPQFKGEDVPDPYFGGEKGFQEVYEILNRSVGQFLREKF